MKPEDAVARADELVTRERLSEMVEKYRACHMDLDRMPEVVAASTEDRLAFRIAIRKLAGVI